MRAGAAPAAAEDVRTLQIADGVATFVEHALGGARENGSSRTDDTGETFGCSPGISAMAPGHTPPNQ